MFKIGDRIRLINNAPTSKRSSGVRICTEKGIIFILEKNDFFQGDGNKIYMDWDSIAKGLPQNESRRGWVSSEEFELVPYNKIIIVGR